MLSLFLSRYTRGFNGKDKKVGGLAVFGFRKRGEKGTRPSFNCFLNSTALSFTPSTRSLSCFAQKRKKLCILALALANARSRSLSLYHLVAAKKRMVDLSEKNHRKRIDFFFFFWDGKCFVLFFCSSLFLIRAERTEGVVKNGTRFPPLLLSPEWGERASERERERKAEG